jgi:hypothetical protein
MTTKLYDLPMRQDPRPRILGLLNDDPDGWVEFDHIDGAYSYCVAFNGQGEKLGVCHLAAWTPLEPVEGGWRVVEPKEDDE